MVKKQINDINRNHKVRVYYNDKRQNDICQPVIDMVETYLRKQFPGRRLVRFSKLNGKCEIYGLNSVEIKVIEVVEPMTKRKELFYQIVKKII